MKMKKGLIMVVFLLAMSSIMAAMSYSSAKVTSAMTGSVTNTNESLLALSVTDKSHNAAKLVNGNLVIDFSNDNVNNSPKKYGLQKNSEYIWEDLFLVKNNSENTVDVTIKTAAALPTGVTLEVTVDGGANWAKINNDANTFLKINNMKTFDSKKVTVKVKVAANATIAATGFTPDLVVSAVDVPKNPK